MHSFNPDTAVIVGVNAAILHQNIAFWCQKNQANNKHFYEGRYWTYNSVQAFGILFPYMTPKQIRTSLDKLVAEGLILKAQLGIEEGDYSNWYANLLQEEHNTDQQPLPSGADPLPSRANPLPSRANTTDSKPVVKRRSKQDNNMRENFFKISDMNVDQQAAMMKHIEEMLSVKGYRSFKPNHFYDWLKANGNIFENPMGRAPSGLSGLMDKYATL
jgi:hypothetical protein